MTSKTGEMIFLKKQLANMFNVKIHLDLYASASYVTCAVFIKMLLGLNRLTASVLQSTLLTFDVIKIDLIIKQDGGRLVSLVLQYFRNRACYTKFNNQQLLQRFLSTRH